MSTQSGPAPARASHIESRPYRLAFPRVVRSEAIKLTTLRSTWWSLALVAVVTIGIALLLAAATNTPGYPAIQLVVAPISFTMLFAGILGAIAVTGEYSTGMIRSTLTAQPQRGAVLAAKAVVVALVVFVSSLVVLVAAALAVAPVLADKGMGIAWDDPAQSVLPLLAAALSLAAFALIGLSFGFLLRNGSGAIAATVGLLFVLPIVVSMFPYSDPSWQWIHDLGAYLPMNLSSSLAVIGDDAAGLSDGGALLALAAWVAAGLAAAWAVLRTRDA